MNHSLIISGVDMHPIGLRVYLTATAMLLASLFARRK